MKNYYYTVTQGDLDNDMPTSKKCERIATLKEARKIFSEVKKDALKDPYLNYACEEWKICLWKNFVDEDGEDEDLELLQEYIFETKTKKTIKR